MVSSSNKLKQRSIYLYLPSTKMAEDWKTRAEKQSLSVSKFVVEHVLDSIRGEEKENQGALSKSDLAKALRETKDELKRVTKECSLYRQLSEKLDNELKYYRTRPFADEDYKVKRSYDRHLADLIETRGAIDSDRLLDELGVDPKQTELVKGIRTELDGLERFGLIESTRRGWKWVQKSKV